MCDSVTVTLKNCQKCGIAKPVTEFYSRNRGSSDGLCSYCKDCDSKLGETRREKNKARETVIVPDFKTCPECKTEKPGSCFSKDNGRLDGLSGWCKECVAKNTNKWFKKNKVRETIVVPDSKICPGCELEKASLLFSKSGRNKDGLDSRCKKCHLVSDRVRLYGLSPEQFDAMLESQGGSCYICKFVPGPEGEELDVDHIHGTKIVRGLLHRKCNRGLGFFKDSVQAIRKAIEYLIGPSLGVVYKANLDKAIKTKILRAQGYLCRICSVDLHDKRVHFDHDHLTGMVRGALCQGCNCGLGQFDDSVGLLQKTILYLEKSEGNNLVSITKSSKKTPLLSFGETI